MKIAFVGKGGSGKTTLSSTIIRYLGDQNFPVLAIDADINQHLGPSLGLQTTESEKTPAMGLEISRIKDYLRGTNERIATSANMIKTTPPGSGSNLMTLNNENPIFVYFARNIGSLKLMAVGPFTEDDLGVKCYHSKTGSVELILNHLIDQKKEYVVVDMTAGADSFASGLFTRFDVTFLVVEPTVKSVSVYEQYKQYATDYDVTIRVIGNKIQDESDIDFIKKYVGNDLIATFSHSTFIRNMEKGQMRPLSEIESTNREALDNIIKEVDKQEKDWEGYYDQAVVFHRKNAESWANAASGMDVTTQIDPDFSLEDAIASM